MAEQVQIDPELGELDIVKRALNVLIGIAENDTILDEHRIAAAELILKWDIDSV